MEALRSKSGFLLFLGLLLGLVLAAPVPAASAPDVSPAHLSTFAAGSGPHYADGVYRLLDAERTPGQSNAVAFDLAQQGTFERTTLRCRLRVLKGGDGGTLLFLNTAEYGRRGPAPFLKNWTEPNLAGSFAVGIDVHDPTVDKPAGRLANYQGLPQREVSLHWDGREIDRRLAPKEFRGGFTDCEVVIQQVVGGAEVSVRLAGAAVYDRYFVAGMLPYESRLAIGAGTGEDTTTEFDVSDIAFTKSDPAQPRRPPKHYQLFNHVRTGNAVPSPRQRVSLPPPDWAYGRVVLTLEINDDGPDWDQWDRNGALYLVGADGVKRDIAPFITSFRTPCHWQVDVTPFRPWLAGEVTFEIEAGTRFEGDRGYMLSASLDFYPGTPALVPFRVVPLWVGTARYKSAANHFRDFFPPRSVPIDPATRAARLFITATGHSPVGEFTPSRRTVVFVPDRDDPPKAQRLANLLWKSDCYLNPNRPQHGTWYLSRAGWAPGEMVRPWWIDLTPHLLPGKTAILRYEPQPYDFSGKPLDRRPTENQIDQALQVVRAYLVLYRSPAGLEPAPSLQIIGVEKGSNADQAGLEENDYLASYDGKRPGTIDELRAAIREAAAAGKKRITVAVYRGSERLEKTLDPGRMGVRLAEGP